MALEITAAALLLKMRRDGVVPGRVLTLGHQHTHIDPPTYRRILGRLNLPPSDRVPVFADDLLKTMGATEVESLDASTYEGATRLHDLNQPVPRDWHEQFDLVFDGGTLEHVFNVGTALKSCMQMVKPRGRFVSVTVPNNWCGHGFYQFSPELFFRALSPENGFSIVEIYFAEVDGSRYYHVTDPAVVKSRVQLWTSEPLFLLVHAQRNAVRDVFATVPQQSDYVSDWAESSRMATHPERYQAWKESPLLQPIRHVRRQLLRRRHRRIFSLNNRAFYRPVDLRI
jgi:SAM-dependent methyltransferase